MVRAFFFFRGQERSVDIPDGGGLAALKELPGAHAEGGLEGTEEGGVVPEAGLLRRLHHGGALAQQLPRQKEPLLGDILVEGIARHRLEPVHQVVAGKVEAPGQTVHAEFFPQVGGDIL